MLKCIQNSVADFLSFIQMGCHPKQLADIATICAVPKMDARQPSHAMH